MGFGAVLLPLLGAAFGALIAWLLFRGETAGTRSRLSFTQSELASARAEVTRLTQSNAQHGAKIAALEATLVHERTANEEKLDLLNRATSELREAFQALSAEALKSNNQAFLELAKTSLQKFQSEAKGDLETRQKAVQTL